jgi:ABC-type transport system involved in cytochrome bd biosynthesis fused ATPase/permease subunit
MYTLLCGVVTFASIFFFDEYEALLIIVTMPSSKIFLILFQDDEKNFP